MTNTISTYLEQRIDAGDFPSAVYLVAENARVVMHEALGDAVVEPGTIEARTDTIYDLASLTKPLVTGLLCAKLIEKGELDIEKPVGHYLPESSSGVASEVFGRKTIRELLTHTSSFQAWKPFYLLVRERNEVLAEIVKTSLNTEGPPVVYSDLNFLTLMFVIERIMGQRIDDAAAGMIFRPMGMNSTFFDPPAEFRRRIAASENGNRYEKQTCIEQGFLIEADATDDIFRSETIWGDVHDNNAYFMNGVAGHAGLFSTAEEVFRIAQQFLPTHSSLLKPTTCEFFATNFTDGLNEDRSLAFQLATTSDSTAGSRMSPQSFGHVGFTGTSLWIDPVIDRIFILLTNRTHNHSLPFVNINSVRRNFHDLAISMLDADY